MNQAYTLDQTSLSIFGLPALKWACLSSVMSLNLSAVGFSGEMVLLVELGTLKEASKIPTLPLGDALR